MKQKVNYFDLKQISKFLKFTWILSACLPAIRPGSARCTDPEISHNTGNLGRFTKLLFQLMQHDSLYPSFPLYPLNVLIIHYGFSSYTELTQLLVSSHHCNHYFYIVLLRLILISAKQSLTKNRNSLQVSPLLTTKF